MKTVQVVSTNKVLRIAKEENRNRGQKQKKSRVRGLFLSYQKDGHGGGRNNFAFFPFA